MSKNQHITDFLDYYCKLENPEYAVLLKGSWGAGKTWFINNYIKTKSLQTNDFLSKIKLELTQSKYIYISLYGIKSIAQIEYIFLQQFLPSLRHKFINAAKDFGKVTAKGFRINLSGDEIKFSEYFNPEKHILIFDDLERCQISMKEILGYINTFVEHKGFKVIIIAAEEEISDKDKDEYGKIKEKSIGYTFEIQSHIDEVLPSLINKLGDTAAKRALNNNSLIIKELYTQATYNNFRVLKQTLWDFERIYEILPEDARKKDELIIHLLIQLLIYSLEVKCGKIQSKDIDTPNLLTEENKKIYGKYKYSYFSYLYTPLIGINIWKNFFDKGILPDIHTLKESLSQSSYYKDVNISALPKLIKNIHELSDEKFEELQTQVETEYNDKKYSITTVLTAIGLFLHWSDIGLYKKTKKDILLSGQEYINYLLLKERDSTFATLEKINYRQFGRVFYDIAIPAEYETLSQYIDKQMEESKNERMKEKGINLLNIMKEDTRQFARMVYLSNYNNDLTYIQIPIFKYIIPKDFIETLLTLDATNRGTVFYALTERYKYDNMLQPLIEELDWLKSIQHLLIEKQKELKRKLSGYYIELFLEKLKQVIEKIESQKTQNQTSL